MKRPEYKMQFTYMQTLDYAKACNEYIDGLEQQLVDLKASLPKVRADAVSYAISMVVLGILSDDVEFMKGFESAEMQYSMQLQKISHKLEAGNV